MPAVFQTGSTVPMDIDLNSPMTEDDHVRRIRVFAPLNPIVEVASFHFTPRRSLPRVSARIRLASPRTWSRWPRSTTAPADERDPGLGRHRRLRLTSARKLCQ